MQVGENWLVDDGANVYLGRVTAVEFPNTVHLEDVTWVCDTGRRHVFFACKTVAAMKAMDPQPELEYHGAGSRSVVTRKTAHLWPHPLPTETI